MHAATPASAPRRRSRNVSPTRARPCCASCWRGSATSRARAPREPGAASFDDRIYVFTPQASIIDLPAGGTAVDFAYALHTDLGHRCRGARVDRVMVPLNKPLASGQTVEIVAAKEGGPSLDWLNPELGYLASPRSRAKVRAWFNAQAQSETIARGREAVEKLLQREGRTALKLDTLAEQLGFKNADALFEVVGKDEFSLRNIENVLRPAEPAPDDDRVALHRPRSVAGGGRGGVLVVGIDSLLTTLARCCRPAPPDVIAGFVTRGRGVAVHRADCTNLRHMAQTAPGRVIDVAWGAPRWRQGGGLPAGRADRSRRPARPAARHLRGLCQGQDERHRRAHPVGQGPQRGLDDLHRGTQRRLAAGARCWRRSAACRAYVTRGANSGGHAVRI